MALVTAVGVLTLLGAAAGQCDLYQEVAVGAKYDIKSPGYPGSYSPGAACRWRAVSPSGSRLRLTCGMFDVPASSGCKEDRVAISPSGALNMSDAHLYCGRGTFSIASDANRLTMELYAAANSNGGVFLCNITAVRDAADCNCGWKKQTRIVGGTETEVNEFPMMAALVDFTQKRLYCGATIVSERHALTAAHCIMNKQPSNMGLLVGDHDISTGNDTTASKLYLITNLIMHPQYNNVSQANDLGVIEVTGIITFSQQVLPACLPFNYQQYDFKGQIVKVLGWGTIEYGGPTSDRLLQANLNVISYEACRSSHGAAVTINQICTLAQGKDACQTDSGGPVLWQDPYTGRIHLVGIISYGISCAADIPGVNTRITSYLSWIQATTGDQFCRV